MAKKSQPVSKFTHIKMFGDKAPSLSQGDEVLQDFQNSNDDFYQQHNKLNQSANYYSQNHQNNQVQEQALPAFLQTVHEKKALDPVEDAYFQAEVPSNDLYKEFKPKENNLLTFGYLGTENKNSNPNSFSSIFNKDNAEQAGVQRVFRKSTAFLVATSIFFAGIVICGINFFQINFLISLLFITFFTVTSNIFFIILADKSYIWLTLAIQSVFLLLFNSFIGQGFNLITLLFILVVSLLTYISYVEVEKFQLGSRLFKISIITAESTRLLTNLAIIVIALGVFNSINSLGSQKFVDDVILKNEFITDTFFYGVGGAGLNKVMINSHSFFVANPENYTFYDVLEDNYKNNETIKLNEDKNKFTQCNDSKAGVDSEACKESLKQLYYERAQVWADVRYPNIDFPVQTKLTPQRYDQVVKEYYSQGVKNFISVDNSISTQNIPIPVPSFIPRQTLIPAVVAILVYVILFIIRMPLIWLVQILTSIFWKILEMTNFVNIDVENVEAEVVSI